MEAFSTNENKALTSSRNGESMHSQRTIPTLWLSLGATRLLSEVPKALEIF